MRYDVIEKIGEGNRGEVYKIKLQNGEYAALKWAKSYEIDKEWEILSFLYGNYAPKPLFRGKRYLVMELIEGKPLKELIGKALNRVCRATYSSKSYNNKFGVPLSLFNLNKNDDFGVFEVGMDKKGEIDTLTKIIRPDVGVITNISYAHIKNFKNFQRNQPLYMQRLNVNFEVSLSMKKAIAIIVFGLLR